MALMENKALADELGGCARQTILDGWQWRQTLQRIDDLYDLAVQIHIQRNQGDRTLVQPKRQPDPAGKPDDHPAPVRAPAPAGLLDSDPAVQREAVLLEDAAQWGQQLSQTDRLVAAVEPGLDVWKNRPPIAIPPAKPSSAGSWIG